MVAVASTRCSYVGLGSSLARKRDRRQTEANDAAFERHHHLAGADCGIHRRLDVCLQGFGRREGPCGHLHVVGHAVVDQLEGHIADVVPVARRRDSVLDRAVGGDIAFDARGDAFVAVLPSRQGQILPPLDAGFHRAVHGDDGMRLGERVTFLELARRAEEIRRPAVAGCAHAYLVQAEILGMQPCVAGRLQQRAGADRDQVVLQNEGARVDLVHRDRRRRIRVDARFEAVPIVDEIAAPAGGQPDVALRQDRGVFTDGDLVVRPEIDGRSADHDADAAVGFRVGLDVHGSRPARRHDDPAGGDEVRVRSHIDLCHVREGLDRGIDMHAASQAGGDEGVLFLCVDLVERAQRQNRVVALFAHDRDIGIADHDVRVERDRRVAVRARAAHQPRGQAVEVGRAARERRLADVIAGIDLDISGYELDVVAHSGRHVRGNGMVGVGAGAGNEARAGGQHARVENGRVRRGDVRDAAAARRKIDVPTCRALADFRCDVARIDGLRPCRRCCDRARSTCVGLGVVVVRTGRSQREAPTGEIHPGAEIGFGGRVGRGDRLRDADRNEAADVAVRLGLLPRRVGRRHDGCATDVERRAVGDITRDMAGVGRMGEGRVNPDEPACGAARIGVGRIPARPCRLAGHDGQAAGINVASSAADIGIDGGRDRCLGLGDADCGEAGIHALGGSGRISGKRRAQCDSAVDVEVDAGLHIRFHGRIDRDRRDVAGTGPDPG